MIFDLIKDFVDVLEAMPREHPWHGILKLLDEAIRRDVHFIDRHPTTLFQCLWNTCWWYDCPEACDFYAPPANPQVELRHFAGTLHEMLEAWHERKHEATPDFLWLEARRPPAQPLNSAMTAVFRGHRLAVKAVDSLGKFQHIASASQDGTIRVWDVATGGEQYMFSEHQSGVQCLGSSQDCIVSGDEAGEILVWRALTGQIVARRQMHQGPVHRVGLSPERERVAIIAGDREIRIWELHSEGESLTIAGHAGDARDVGWTADGQFLVSVGDDESLRVYDVAGRQYKTVVKLPIAATHVALPEQGDTVFCALMDGSLASVNLTSGGVIRHWSGHDGYINGIECSPDGRLLASASDDATVCVWDVRDGKRIACLRGHEDEALCVSFLPGTSKLVSGGSDRTLRLWSPMRESQTRELKDPRGPVHCLAFGPGGRSLCSVTGDHTLAIWDVSTGLCSSETRIPVGTNVYDLVQHIVARARTEVTLEQLRYQAWPVDDETQIRQIVDQRLVAVFPQRFDPLAAHPTEATWAGAIGNWAGTFSGCICLLSLRGTQNDLDDPAAPASKCLTPESYAGGRHDF